MGWLVSVGVAMSATDGIVVFVDGRTSDSVSGKAQADETVKLVVAPHELPFVVVPLGRASVGGVSAVDLVESVLADLPYEDLRTMDLRTVTLHLMSGLVAAAAVWPQGLQDEDGNEFRNGFHLLVSGYGATTAPSRAEVWTATVPTRGLAPNLSTEAVTVCGPGQDSDTLIYDLFDRFAEGLEEETLADDTDTYRLSGMTMAQVRVEAEARLRTAAAMNPDELYAGGVGGWWLLAQVGPDGTAKVERVDIGPMVVNV